MELEDSRDVKNTLYHFTLPSFHALGSQNSTMELHMGRFIYSSHN